MRTQERLLSRREILGKTVELCEDYLVQLFGRAQAEKIKLTRPFFVIELSYEGQPQLFALPFFTSIPETVNLIFFHKLPTRLETKTGHFRGLSFGAMIPIVEEAVLKIKQPERKISEVSDSADVLFLNLINQIPERRQAIPVGAEKSYEYLRSEAYNKGKHILSGESAQAAYYKYNCALYQATNKILEKDISPDENGVRPLVQKAQNYLDNHYLKMLEATKAATSSQRNFVEMPRYHTHIDTLIKILYGENS